MEKREILAPTMTKFPRRALKSWGTSWTLMAFFAIFALAASPSFAFGCCCHAAHAFAPTKVSAASIPVAPPVVPSNCHDCEEKSEAASHTFNATANSPASPAATTHSTSVSAPLLQPHLQPRCDCASSDSSQIALTETAGATNFAPFVAGAPSQIFSYSRPFLASIRLAFASDAARPRSPSATHKAGRAPPVFGT